MIFHSRGGIDSLLVLIIIKIFIQNLKVVNINKISYLAQNQIVKQKK